MSTNGASGPHLVLTEGQQRSLGVGVRQLEELLDQLEQALDPPRAAPSHLIVDTDIPPAQSDALRREIDLIRARIAALAELLGVPPVHRSARAAFVAASSSAWTIAEDLHPRRLGAYGPVDAEVTRVLAPMFEELAAHFLALAQRAETPPPSRSTRPAPPATGAGTTHT